MPLSCALLSSTEAAGFAGESIRGRKTWKLVPEPGALSKVI